MNEQILQTEWWGRLKSEFGWKVTVDEGYGTAAVPRIRIFQRTIGPVRLAYLPYAYARGLDQTGSSDSGGSDSVDSDTVDIDRDVLRIAANRLQEITSGLSPRPMLLRWDVPWPSERFDRTVARASGLVPAPVRVQPPDTVLLDLRREEAALLAGMKGKTRYNIRLAARHGVSITRYSAADPAVLPAMVEWYRLYVTTAERDRITIHPEAYYRRVVELAREPGSPLVKLYLAHHEGDLLGGIVVASWQGTSTYLYGAAADIKRNLMASYRLQWAAIRDANARGDRWYDFFGIPPTDDPSHPMHGLFRFKTGFGGSIVHRPGCWDLLSAPVGARLFRGAEVVRGWYYHDLRKRFSLSTSRRNTSGGTDGTTGGGG